MSVICFLYYALYAQQAKTLQAKGFKLFIVHEAALRLLFWYQCEVLGQHLNRSNVAFYVTFEADELLVLMVTFL